MSLARAQDAVGNSPNEKESMLIYRKKLERLVKNFIEKNIPAFLQVVGKTYSPIVEAIEDSAIVKNSLQFLKIISWSWYYSIINSILHLI